MGECCLRTGLCAERNSTCFTRLFNGRGSVDSQMFIRFVTEAAQRWYPLFERYPGVLVRIKLSHSPSKFRQRPHSKKNQALALALASLLTPASLLAFSMAFWRIAADLHWTGEFSISNGILSHWQTWLVAAAALLAVASVLNRWGGSMAKPVSPAAIEMLSQQSAPLQEIGSRSTE